MSSDVATAQSRPQSFERLFPAHGGLTLPAQAAPGGAGRSRTLSRAALGAIQSPIAPIRRQLWSLTRPPSLLESAFEEEL